MKLSTQIRLIPRNNWDYGFTALKNSYVGALKNSGSATNVKSVFQQNPIFTNSGRTSLYAILKALELPVGAKVGVPLFCCSVVFNAICQAGLTPRFLDSNLSDCNLAVEDFRKKRSDLAAVIAVHMFGQPCNMDAINSVAKNIPVIEDCAQSIFSIYRNKITGSLATASFFSFRCGKYISAGEGSAVFCRDLELQKKIEQTVSSFRGCSTVNMFVDAFMTFIKAALYNRPWYGMIGYPIGTRLDKKLNLTAKDGFSAEKISPTNLALIEARITRFQEKINIQRAHAHLLLAALEPGNFVLPTENNGCSSNWFQFAIRFKNPRQRDVMADYLFQQGIDTAKYLDNIDIETRTNYGYTGDCPNAELLSKTVLLIPIYYTLNDNDIEHIARAINEGSKLV